MPLKVSAQIVWAADIPDQPAALAEKLGATLVESTDPLWSRDTDIELMTTDFRRALARLVPVFMPDLLFRLGRDAKPVFTDFAAAIVPTEFMPGKVFGTGEMKPIDYLVELAEGRIAPPSTLDLGTIQRRRDAANDAARNLILQIEYVFEIAIKPFGPQVGSVGRFDELTSDSHAVA